MVRVAGTDPGTSSLDVLILEDGAVADQCRFLPDQLQQDPSCPVKWLYQRGPFDLIAGPSGYGLPLIAAENCLEEDCSLMVLLRPDEHGKDQGVLKFRSLVDEFCGAPLPVLFLPGVIHLRTVPVHRKINRIDLGTPDKLCVAALAVDHMLMHEMKPLNEASFCLVELGSAFTSLIVVDQGHIVDGAGGTSGAVGYRSGGAWDGEVAYWLSPLTKNDLFSGGLRNCPSTRIGERLFLESIRKQVGALRAVHNFDRIVLSGRLLETESDLAQKVKTELRSFAEVIDLPSLPGAWVKHAAQGAAMIAEALAGGKWQYLIELLQLRDAEGTVLDWLMVRGD